MKEADIILSLLNHGEINALSAEYLEQMTHLNARTIRFIIQYLRETDVCILSGKSGYWLPSEDELEALLECSRFTNTMKRRGVTSLRIARATEAHMRKIDGQYSIDDLLDSESSNGKFHKSRNTIGIIKRGSKRW